MQTCPTCNGKKVMVYSCCTGEPVYNESMVCPVCRELLGEEPCETCGGTGEVEEEKQILMNKHEEILKKYVDASISSGALIPEEAALKAMQEVSREQPLREALENLVQLKDWKDKHGKDEYYEKYQPLAWEAARTALEGDVWIRVEDGLPETSKERNGNSDWVLAATNNGICTGLAKYCSSGKWVVADYSQYFEGITHWRPLPSPPQNSSI